MKRLIIWLAILLPLWVNAQTNGTLQMMPDTTLRGAFGSRGTALIPTVSVLGTNGYILVYNGATKKYVPTDPGTIIPTISFGTFGSTPNAQGGSYSGGVITLQPADATNPGGLSTGTQSIAGAKTLTSNATIATGGSSFLNITGGTTGSEAGIILNDGGTSKWELFKAGSSHNFGLYNYGTSTSAFSIASSNNAFTINSLASGLVKATSGELSIATAGTDYLTPTGSGSGLSGVVLTTTNQNIAGVKTLTDSLLSVRSSNNKLKVQVTGASAGASIDIHRGDKNGFAYLRYYNKNDASYRWQAGMYQSENKYYIQNATTGSLQDAFVIDTLNNINILKDVISATKGTLYGTASGSITSSELRTSLTDETGTGSAVFATSPTLVTPNIGVATGSTLALTSNSTLLTGSPSTSTLRAIGLFSNSSSNLAWGSNGVTPNDVFGNSLAYQALIGTTTNNPFGIATNNSVVATFETDGDLVITGSNATKASGTAWINPSDLRLKTNVGEYSKGLAEVLKIKPKTWYFNEASGFDTTKLHLSPIAQELREVMPEMVSTYKGKLNGKAHELLQVDASDMTWLLVKAIQDQQEIIEKLNERITVLENK